MFQGQVLRRAFFLSFPRSVERTRYAFLSPGGSLQVFRQQVGDLSPTALVVFDLLGGWESFVHQHRLALFSAVQQFYGDLCRLRRLFLQFRQRQAEINSLLARISLLEHCACAPALAAEANDEVVLINLVDGDV